MGVWQTPIIQDTIYFLGRAHSNWGNEFHYIMFPTNYHETFWHVTFIPHIFSFTLNVSTYTSFYTGCVYRIGLYYCIRILELNRSSSKLTIYIVPIQYTYYIYIIWCTCDAWVCVSVCECVCHSKFQNKNWKV